ncbi:MAG: hypothetical protein INQ03_00225 [Candidatus Heimdallarchaeota archaeon]|nr:hypothetical protein [Candidatus Heimdallarchaeota archaeon]
MKLEEIARKSIDIIKEKGSDGVTTSYLAEVLQVPKRRVYDVKAIMKAAGLINTHRDRNGTRLYWNQINDSDSKQVSKIRSNKIKITTTGLITNISNRGTEVIIEGTSPSMTIETID